jgi:limonene-1,2-epoxide hydrolase
MADIITKFYTAFENLDVDTMVSCYHNDVHFEDPAFGTLKGERAKNMWRMLLGTRKGNDFKVDFSDIKVTDSNGSAHWEAIYEFSKTGRTVHNKIDAKFRLKDGLIIEHIDHFNMYAWSKQALGGSAYLIGWTGFFKKKLQEQTNKLLSQFENK